MLTVLQKSFSSRQALADYVADLQQLPRATISPISPHDLADRLAALDPITYGKTRNYLAGAVTQLSPFISRGMISLETVYHHVCERVNSPRRAYKLLQELTWRLFWQQVTIHHPNWLWHDAEPYKTGWQPDDYADELPQDVLNATTDCVCINQFINTLYITGYLHNHARMYLAAYVVHWRRVKWQVGARWFLQHLLDGYAPSNNFSWQWVASTFSHKPYIFNLANVDKYADTMIDVRAEHNQPLDASYACLDRRLFPYRQILR